MKIYLPGSTKAYGISRQNGSAVIVVMAIIAILLIYIGGNLRALHLLQRDLKQVEQKQLSRTAKTAVRAEASSSRIAHVTSGIAMSSTNMTQTNTTPLIPSH